MTEIQETPTVEVTETPKVADGLLDLEGLRLSQDFTEFAGVKRLITTVPVRKPNRQEYVRVNPGAGWQFQTLVMELKEDRDSYIVTPEMASEMPGEAVPKMLRTTINRQGVVSIWPIRLPGEDGRLDNWNQSAMEAAQIAEEKWVRVAANMSLGAYDVFEAMGELPEPEWPDISFNELITIAFKGRIIDSPDHPVLKRLKGLV
jgi:hypothetical protein